MLSQENESAYMGDEDPREADWSEEMPQETEPWVSGLVIPDGTGVCRKGFVVF